MHQLKDGGAQIPRPKTRSTETAENPEAAYQRGYQNGTQDALKAIEMVPNTEVWDLAAVNLVDWLSGQRTVVHNLRAARRSQARSDR